MKKSSLALACCALVAQAFFNLSPSWAGSSGNTVDSAQATVQAKLVQPLEAKESTRSRYSRAALPPQSRRIRILDKVAESDAQGKPFLAFAIDESRGYQVAKADDANWRKDTITGCVYPKSGEVMIKRGDVYYPAAMLWGVRSTAAASGVCRAN